MLESRKVFSNSPPGYFSYEFIEFNSISTEESTKLLMIFFFLLFLKLEHRTGCEEFYQTVVTAVRLLVRQSPGRALQRSHPIITMLTDNHSSPLVASHSASLCSSGSLVISKIDTPKIKSKNPFYSRICGIKSSNFV